ncbi:putative glycolipid-binding domain-containing protein [Microbacterium sp. LMI1-1-1.1]|uniref:putative glycolipid-binding domain-containing protein n=1 Tax=Microbacterium sp. LMI1-1-1.1 TaxID=3135223 RepID=UPI0034664667
MELQRLPQGAAWSHRGARDGFEVAFFRPLGSGYRISGHTSADEDSTRWSVGYEVEVDAAWTTTRVRATTLTEGGERDVALRCDGGRWSVDGEFRPDLDGCHDVDFESSAVTNTLPLHRLALGEGVGVDVPAVFVRADDLRVERLEQRYTLLARSADSLTFHYASTTFGFACKLRYDGAGLIVDYPGIAVRHS